MRKKEKLTITVDKEILEILEKISLEKCINKSKFVNKILKKYLNDNDIR